MSIPENQLKEIMAKVNDQYGKTMKELADGPSWKKMEQRIQELEKQKDGAYSERNHLVSALSKIYLSTLERHEESDKDWEDDWRWIVVINLPTGQASWHIHDSELPMFEHLNRNMGYKWDGHTTEQKYDRLKALKRRY